MPHIHTEPGQHDHSVTAFIIRVDSDEPKLLLHMHRKLGTLMPPGGHIELDETPWAALEHELLEETGYTFRQLDIVQPKTRMKTLSEITLHPQPILSNSHYIPDGHFHTDLDYLFIAHDDPENQPQEGESTEFYWLSHDEIRELPKEKIMSNIREIAEYIFITLLDAEDHEQVAASGFRTDKISRT